MTHTLEQGVWACVQDPQGVFLSSGYWRGKGVTVRSLLLFVRFCEEKHSLPENHQASVVLFHSVLSDFAFLQ